MSATASAIACVGVPASYYFVPFGHACRHIYTDDMNLVMFSDSHGARPTIPEGDVLCVAGDVFCGDDLQSLRSDLRWLGSLPHKRKLFVQGNHDLVLKMQSNAEELLAEQGITLLNNNSIDVDGVRFYGVSYGATDIQPCDVLMSHVPPAGVLDKGLYGKALGCPRLLTAVQRLKPRVHLFGHAHESAGHTKIDETDFYNCAERPTSVHIYTGSVAERPIASD